MQSITPDKTRQGWCWLTAEIAGLAVLFHRAVGRAGDGAAATDGEAVRTGVCLDPGYEDSEDRHEEHDEREGREAHAGYRRGLSCLERL